MITNYQQQFAKLANTQDWLQQRRQEAFAIFEKIGFPNCREENWKYTNVKPLLNREFTLPRITQTQLTKLTLPDIDCYQIIFINGHYSSENSSNFSENVLVKNLATAIQEGDAEAKKNLNQLAKNINHGFAALNMAFTQQGAYIKILANTTTTKPIHLIYLTTENNIVHYPRNLIIAEANSRATIIESYLTVNANNYFTNAITEMVLQPGSQVEHIKIQQEQTDAYHIATTQIQQEQDSYYNSQVYSFGAALSRSDINITLVGTGASCNLTGLYLCRGKQHMDHHTRVEHVKNHTVSRECYRGILDGFSRAVFNGQIVVHPHAHHADAEQSNKNLLLSKQAEIDTKPQLEIFNDEVKCTHGATVGQLDETQLFYLRSRGIEEANAKAMLVHAFASEIIEKIKDKKLKSYLNDLI